MREYYYCCETVRFEEAAHVASNSCSLDPRPDGPTGHHAIQLTVLLCPDSTVIDDRTLGAVDNSTSSLISHIRAVMSSEQEASSVDELLRLI